MSETVIIPQADTMYYVHKDYLRSYFCITDESGKIAKNKRGEKQIYSFDPWGRRRNYKDWTYTGAPDSYLFDRGFTGHQHLDAFHLINMNGRVYDPWLGRFLSPDNFVQSPTYSQNFNRYSYAVNNPLKYTDPDGEWVQFVIGALIGGTLNWISHGAEFNLQGLGYFGVGALAGALAAGIGAGVGVALADNATTGGGFVAGFLETATKTSTGFVAGAISGAAAGVTNGLILGTGNGMISGRNFEDAFVKGGLNQAWQQGLGGVAFGGIMGALDAINSHEDWLTGSPHKKYAFTNGKNMMSPDAAEVKHSTSTQKKASIKLQKTDDPYTIEIKASKGWRITDPTGKFSRKDLPSYEYATDKNSVITTFPVGTPNGGYYATRVQQPLRILNHNNHLMLFFANKRNFSTLFWYLKLF